MDTFICGSCQMTFNDIEQFVIHKKDCNVNLLPPTSQPETQSSQQVENENVGHVVVSTADSNAEDQVMAFPEGSRVVTTEVVDSVTGEQQTVIIIQPAPGSEMPGSQGVTLDGQTPGSGKKRGRPKKEKQTDSIPVAKVQKVEKPSVPEMGADGKLYCKACKKSFHKERFFKTHRCMPTTDYVDITKKSVLTVEYGENEEAVSASEDEELDNDEDKDFRVSDYKLKDAEEEEDNELEEDGDEEERGEGKPKKKRRSYKVRMDADGDENKGARPTDQIGDVPIFRTEAEKSLFEQSLNVDLSFVDNLFRQHMIEQDLNDKAPVASRMTTNTLSLYSCNMCDKIFKTLSHMRLHCLTHTDSKPFKCPKCPYRSNGKGNLYTHMRKHTGQYFRCKFCDFKSVNKSHVLEHEAVHSNVRHQCDLCKKDYNTLKSLINHIRKYHKNSPKGEEYLSSFLQGGRQRGATVIHQCHVCNRKFKKKIDRDRHLYVHDIKDIPTIQMCSLCDYTASRKVYLEKHFQKHRVIYRCVKCEEKFLSTIRLIDHLTNTHLQDDATTKWESMFEECINNSLYLPEPDEMLSSAEKELVSLPAELSQTDLEGKAKVEVEQVPGETTGTIEAVQGGQDLPMSETEGQNVDEVEPEVTPSVEEGNIKTEEKDDEQIEDNDLLTSDPQSSSKNENASSQAEEAHLPLADQESSTVNENEDTVLSSTEETGGTSIEENVLEIPKEEKLDSADLIKTLGYRPLTLQVFHKMRETFGHEECEYCGKLYYNKMDYDQHVRTHTGDNPYPCSICGYRALSRDSLQSHKATEHEKLSFPCKECEFTANSRSQLWNHSLKHSGFGEDMGIECPECQQKLPSWTLFKDHVSEAHPDSKNKELNKLHIYAGLESSPKHKVQGKIGRRSYKCPYCDKMFFRANSELQKHIWIHEGVKPFKCPLCPHACRSKNNLQAHMLRHSNEKPYTCTDCNKAYKSKTALRWHVRSHKSGRLFKCSKCPYEATQAAHLRRHMEIHNVIKKYACQHCSYTANTLSYLKVHHTRSHKGVPYKNVDVPVVEETGHDSTGASQVYRCLSCDYLFGNLTDLKRHLKIRHHLTLTNFAGLDGDKSTTITNLTEPVTSFPEESSTTGMMTEVGQDSAVPEINEVHTVDASATEIDSSNLDAKTASAVNILQQIFGMSQQNSGGPQQFTIQSESGEVMTVNPETIIVQEGGEQVLVTDGNQPENGHQQYVIQYVNQDQIENSMVEIQTIQDVQHFQTIEQEIIHSMEAQPLGDNVVEQQIVQS